MQMLGLHHRLMAMSACNKIEAGRSCRGATSPGLSRPAMTTLTMPVPDPNNRSWDRSFQL